MKPIVKGTVLNIEPDELVTSARLRLFQVNDGEIGDISNVCVDGRKLSLGYSLTGHADICTWVPPSDQYMVDLRRGMFTLNPWNSGVVTCDVRAVDVPRSFTDKLLARRLRVAEIYQKKAALMESLQLFSDHMADNGNTECKLSLGRLGNPSIDLPLEAVRDGIDRRIADIKEQMTEVEAELCGDGSWDCGYV